jgi:sigma-B regulation protein RsbU (phosphoserine phosphatase)
VSDLREDLNRLKQKNAAYQALCILFEDFIKLAASHKPEVIQGVLQKTVNVSTELTGAEKGSLFLLDEKGVVTDYLLAREDISPQNESNLVGRILDKGLAGWVCRHHRIGLVYDTETDERWLTLADQPFAIRSALVVPIISAERLLAILTLMHPGPGHFTDDSAELMKLTAAQMALVLENARLFNELDQSLASLTRAKEKIERYSRALDNELEKGRQIQKDFLPPTLPHLSGWDIRALFRPARQVAGDFYDAFMLPGGHVSLVIGDVCDKGVGSALFMALFRSLIRIFSGQAQLGRTPVNARNQTVGGKVPASTIRPTDQLDALRTIALTNDYIAREHDRMCMFATIFFGVLDPDSGLFHYINGGHDPVFIIGAEGIKKTLAPTGPALGIAAETTFAYNKVFIEPGDIILAYTDGVTDARSPENEIFSKRRLTKILDRKREDVGELLSRIEDALTTHVGPAAQDDDITILAVQRLS